MLILLSEYFFKASHENGRLRYLNEYESIFGQAVISYSTYESSHSTELLERE